jgi:hypothetical protein
VELFQGQETQIKTKVCLEGRDSFRLPVKFLGHQKENVFCQNLVQRKALLTDIRAHQYQAG